MGKIAGFKSWLRSCSAYRAGQCNASCQSQLRLGMQIFLVSLGRAYCSYGISKLELNYHVPIQSQAFCLPFFVKETNQACGGILVGLVTKCLSIHQRFILGMWNNDSSKVLDNLFPRFVDLFFATQVFGCRKEGLCACGWHRLLDSTDSNQTDSNALNERCGKVLSSNIRFFFSFADFANLLVVPCCYRISPESPLLAKVLTTISQAMLEDTPLTSRHLLAADSRLPFFLVPGYRLATCAFHDHRVPVLHVIIYI